MVPIRLGSECRTRIQTLPTWFLPRIDLRGAGAVDCREFFFSTFQEQGTSENNTADFEVSDSFQNFSKDDGPALISEDQGDRYFDDDHSI